MSVEINPITRAANPHAAGMRTAFDKLRAFSKINPNLFRPLAQTMLTGERATGAASEFNEYCARESFEFTYDHVSINVPFVLPLLSRFAKRHGDKTIRYLEIGAYEGRNLVFMDWLLPRRLDVTVIDTWFDELHNPDENYHAIEDRFHGNMRRTRIKSITVKKSLSSAALPLIKASGEKFDLIYVDGSHAALDVLIDLCFCASLLKTGGMMILDDYWHDNIEISGPGVKQAVDHFLSVFGRYFAVCAVYRQVVLVKTEEVPR
ncbi:MAG TPA: class I SAM-dependent methyltransferase [Caulobacteraceae bacterium]|nr:class I SAM-dependent methyltransferase [Caulobacteraceae bacterium]